MKAEGNMTVMEILGRMFGGRGRQLRWGLSELLAMVLLCSLVIAGREYIHKRVEPSPPTAAKMQFAGLPALADPVTVDSEAYFSMENLLKESMAQRLGDNFSLQQKDGEVVLVLGEAISFASGEAELLGESLTILKEVSGRLERNGEYRLVISGHTDNVPIANNVFASNWDLSSARAAAVARYLVSQGIDPQRITTQGFAEFRPMAENGSVDGRRRNRRVEITLCRTLLLQ